MKKKNKLRCSISALILSVVSIANMANFSYAATEVKPQTGDAKVKVVSNLMLPKHVTIPSISFKLKYTKDGVFNGVENKTDSTQPDLINIGGEGRDFTYSTSTVAGEEVNGYQAYILKTDNIIPDASKFTHAGEYVYTIKQDNDSNECNSASEKYITYSKAEYEMHVFVTNEKTGLRVSAAFVKIKVNTDGTEADGSKVNIDEQTTTAYRENDFSFTNYYLPTDQKLAVTNVVNGEYADMTKKFSLTLLVTNPSYVSSTETRKYYAVPVNATTMKPVQDTLVEFQNNSEKKYYLRNGEKLVFVASDYKPSLDVAVTDEDMACLPAGLGYEASFGAHVGYQVNGTVTHGGIKENTVTGNSGEKLTVKTYAFVDVGENKTEFQAAYREAVATGVANKIVPFAFIGLIGILGVYTSMNNRKKNEVK